MKARVRPSASWTRRKIISPVSSRPLALRISAAGWPFGTSHTAVTWPCSTPWRTSPASPRPPRASAKASSNIDLPAPVSPVSTARPRENSMSSRSIRTMSRIDKRASMPNNVPVCGRAKSAFARPALFKQTGGLNQLYQNSGSRAPFRCQNWRGNKGPPAREARPGSEAQLLEGPGNIGSLVLLRLVAAGLHQIIGVLVPFAVGKIVPEHGRRGLRLADLPDRHVGLRQARQRLLDMARGLVLRDHGLEAVDARDVVAFLQIVAADIHLLARELVARTFHLGLGADGIFGVRIFAHHLFERGDRLFGPPLVAADVGNLIVLRGRDQVLRIGR